MGLKNTTCVLLASLLVIVLLSPLHCHAGNPYYDPHIVCLPPVPPDEAGWPTPIYSSVEYLDTLTLCSSYWGRYQANMGCICTSNRGAVHCGPGAPRALLDAVLNPAFAEGQTNFIDLCVFKCFCEDEDEADADRELLDKYSMANTTEQINNLDTQPAVTVNSDGTITMHLAGGQDIRLPQNLDDAQNATSANEGSIEIGSATFLNGVGFSIENTTVAGGAVNSSEGRLCGTICRKTADCGGIDNCVCQSLSSTYEPATNTWLFTSRCFVQSSLGGRKREEYGPCVCNSTYVSLGCCQAGDGIIWEPPDAKLGELAPVDL